MLRAKAGLPHALAALAGLGLSLVVFWPGIALYDSVDQYAQAVSGAYEDWHPPIMARLWSLFQPWWPGTAPMLVVQLGLYWLGIGLIAAACARRSRGGGGWVVIAIGGFLLLSGWMGAILKDAQMVAATTAAIGIVGWFRIAQRPLPVWATAAASVLLLYAGLLRANAVFAIVPLALALSGWLGIGGWKKRAAATLAAILLIIAVSPVVNHRLLGAQSTGIEKSLLVYDISGIAARTGAGAVALGPESIPTGSAGKRCYSPVEWDGLVAAGCPGAVLMNRPTAAVAQLWAVTILRHPLAYAIHRLAHFNATMRLFVPPFLPHAVSPVDSEPNVLGLGVRARPALELLHAVASRAAALPPGWPALWLALDLVALWAAARAASDPLRDLAFALSLSALAMGASFLAVSIASDLRYHMWTMLASMLAFPLLASAGALNRRHAFAAAAILAVIGTVGIAGRLMLAPYV
jgi:hypothetical protein